jgi:serine/threonine protein kinase
MSSPLIDGFTDLVLIGRGGSASVYRARQVQLERDVAVKVLRPTNIDDRTRQLFDSERRLLGQLPKHQNIVTVFDSGFTQDADPFLAMELCARGSLAALVKAQGPLSLEHGVRVAHRMISALDFAHRRSMIHRDVKPENILISDLGEPVLSDFGIASVLDSDGTATDRAFSPHHVAPELLRGVAPAVTADLYSLGSTLFTLLTGRTPHQSAIGERLPISQILARVADPYYPIDIPGDNEFPREFRNLMRALLTKDPTRRISRASDALDALRKVEADLGILGRDLPLPFTEIDEVDDQLHRTSEVDPDATYIGRSTNAAKPTISKTVSKRTGQSRTNAMSPAADGDDGTIIASPRASATGPTPQSTKRVQLDEQFPTPSVASGNESPLDRSAVSSSAARSKQQLVVALLGVSVLIAGAIFAANRSGSSTRRAPVTTVATVSDTAPSIGLSRPTDVVLSDISASSLKVAWRGDDDPSVTYSVNVMHGSEVVKLVDLQRSPATIGELNIDGWVPCVIVVAAQRDTGVVATSDPFCADSVPATTAPRATP